MKRLIINILLIWVVLFSPAGLAQANSVGASLSNFEVDRFGAFNYRMPIDLPPGPGGLRPDISLLYNSQTADGLLGHGWQIEGLSTIHRCTAIPFLHERRRAITFSNSDRLCLDGSYLELVDVNEYRTHIESFTKLIKEDSGIRSVFEARTKSGRIIRYGGNENAWIGQSDHDPKVLSWLVSSISDLYHNQIKFDYAGSSEQRYIQRIDYGNNMLIFEYEQRFNHMTSYLEGIQIPQTQRLKRVAVYIDDTLVREYLLAYKEPEALAPDQLVSVTECVGDGECLRPTQFEWYPVPEFGLEPFAVVDQIAGNDSRNYQVADFNGDGRADIYILGAFHSREDVVYIGGADGHFSEMPGINIQLDRKDDLSNLRVADFNGDGLMDIYHFRYKRLSDVIYLARWDNNHLSFDVIDGIDSGVSRQPKVGDSCVHIACLKFGDFNGDGRTDIYRVRHPSGSVMTDDIYISNGDGTYERIEGIESYVNFQGKRISETELERLRIADFNGDSISDIYQIHYSANGVDKIYLSQGDGEYKQIDGVDTGINPGKNASHNMQRIKFGHFNADGLTDIYYVTPADKFYAKGYWPKCLYAGENYLLKFAASVLYWLTDPVQAQMPPRIKKLTCYKNVSDEIYISKGNGEYVLREGLNFYESRSDLRASLERSKMVDLNNDGLTDIYYVNYSGQSDQVWFYSHDGSFYQKEGVIDDLSGKNSLEDIARNNFSDFNGDGLMDLYHVSQQATKGIQIFNNQLQPMFIEEITDGLGLQTGISYSPLAAVEEHSGSRHSYPDSSITLPIWVATEVSFDGEVAEQFRYIDMRINSAGLGVLGFSRIDRLNVPRQILERSVYKLDYPYLGQLSESIKGTADDWDMDKVFLQQSMHHKILTLNNDKTKFPYVSLMREDRFELDGGVISESTTEYDQYDDYGNAGFVRVVTSGDGKTFHNEMRNEFEYDLNEWLLQHLVRRVETSSDSDNNIIVRTTELEYEPGRLAVAREIIESGHRLSYIREYTYDSFGNRIIERAIPSNPNFSPRMKQYEYDEQGMFAVALHNAEYHIETRLFDSRFGKPTILTDANNLSVKRQYDAWGRLTQEILPDGTNTNVRYTYSLPDDAPENSVYMVEIQKSGYPIRRTYYDQMQRVTREEFVGFDGVRILQDNLYDGLLEELTAVTIPYYEGQDPDQIVWTKRNHDSLGRIMSETTPLPGRDVLFDIRYRGNNEERVNTLGQEQRLTRDVLGRVVKIDDPMGARMRFEYDPIGRLTKMTDINGAEVFMEYDLFGNRTLIKDANSGTRYFSYDSFGQLIHSIDAEGRERYFHYDKLGRLVRREESDDMAEWEYDTAEYGVGQIAKETFRNHVREFNYDEQGRLAQIHDQRGYSVTNHYDEYARIARIDYPKGFSLQRIYNEHGYLEALQGLVSDFPAPGANSTPAHVDYVGKSDEYDMHADFYRKMAEDQPAYLAQRLITAAQELNEGAQTLRELPAEQPVSVEVEDWQDCNRMSQLKIDRTDDVISKLRLSPHIYQSSHKLLVRQLLKEADFYLTCTESANIVLPENISRKQIEFWRVLARDPTGSAIDEIRGNGWRTQKTYSAAHYPVAIKTVDDNGRKRRHLNYFYDELGNIVDRHNYTHGTDEYFEYDALNRLVSSILIEKKDDHSDQVLAYNYDANNNLVFKSDVGSYQYKSEGQSYMVERAGNNVYDYDAAGNLVNSSDYSVRWNPAGKPESIYADDHWIEYQYDANNVRIAKSLSDGSSTYYSGDLFEENINGEVSESCNKIYAERQLVAVYCEKNDTGEIYYLYHDVLGSVDTVADENGKQLAYFDYFPFGERRTIEGNSVLNRGFTGHEHIGIADLIHMNGRIYDAQLGRFLSPDLYIPAPLATQSYNNYSYVMNNPLRYTDPSGFFFKKILKKVGRIFKRVARYIKRNIKTIVAAAAGHYIGNWVATNFIKSAAGNLIWSPGAMANGSYMAAYGQIIDTGNIVGGAVSGGTAALLSGGGVKSVLANSVGGGVFQLANLRYRGNWSPGRVLTNATISGATSMAAGGSFKNAALAGLQGGALRYAAIKMRKMMIAQSMLNPDNAGGTSAGFFNDRFKLGGARNDIYGSNHSILGGNQGGQGVLFGITYTPGSWQDYVVESFSGPHDFLNSWYWYERNGNSKVGFSPLRRWIGEGLNGVNVILAAPFVAASVAPDYFYSLPR